MVAYAYESLGGISGVTENPRVAYSKRGRDRDRYQNFMFDGDPARPFSGVIHVQGSLDAPPQETGIRNKQPSQENLLWSDIARMEFTQEGGNIFLQLEIELAHVRVVCKPGDYWSAVIGGETLTVGVGPSQFTINGIGPITVNAGDNANAVVTAINTDPGIVADGTIVADVAGPANNQLRIYKNDGEDLIILDTVNTPLADMGITSGTYSAGRILKINSMR